MSTIYEVPTKSYPTTQTISLGGTNYKLSLSWCEPASCWIGSLADQTGASILNGFPLITGSDLLAQFAYLNIAGGGGLLVQSDNSPYVVPDYSSLGSTGHLYFVSAS